MAALVPRENRRRARTVANAFGIGDRAIDWRYVRLQMHPQQHHRGGLSAQDEERRRSPSTARDQTKKAATQDDDEAETGMEAATGIHWPARQRHPVPVPGDRAGAIQLPLALWRSATAGLLLLRRSVRSGRAILPDAFQDGFPRLKILAGIVAIFTLLMVFAIQRIPVPVEAKAEGRQFADAWNDTEILPLKKADRFVSVSTEPIPVVVERIAPDAPASAPPVILVADDKPVTSGHGRLRMESNICTRHRMRKVITRGGRSWKCSR